MHQIWCIFKEKWLFFPQKRSAEKRKCQDGNLLSVIWWIKSAVKGLRMNDEITHPRSRLHALDSLRFLVHDVHHMSKTPGCHLQEGLSSRHSHWNPPPTLASPEAREPPKRSGVLARAGGGGGASGGRSGGLGDLVGVAGTVGGQEAEHDPERKSFYLIFF